MTMTQSIQKGNSLLLNTSQVVRTTLWQSNERFARQATTSQATCPFNDTQAVKPFSEMPGPKGLPYVGTLLEYVGPMKKKGYNFHQMHKVLMSRSETYGTVFKEQLGSRIIVTITDPVEYSKVVRADGKYPNRPELDPIKHYLLKNGKNLDMTNSQNEEWYRHRSVLNKKMLRPQEILRYAEKMSLVADNITTQIKAKRDQHTGVVPNIDQILFKWSLESVGEFLFDDRLGCFDENSPPVAQDFIQSICGVFKYMNPLLFNPLYKFFPTHDWRQFEKHYSRALKIGQEIIIKKVEKMVQQEDQGTKNQNKEEDSSFLSYLLVEKKLRPDQAVLYAFDILLGGVETTTNATLWFLYILSKNPRAQEKMYKEIVTVVKDSPTVTSEMLANLPYVKACFKEQLRLFPLISVHPRILQTEIELGGYLVPAGTFVQGNMYTIGRDARFFEDPLEFRPERWLREDKEHQQLIAMASLPFGHGPRMCIGRRLAEQEVYLAAIKVVQKFKLDYAGSEDVDSVQRTVLVPDRPVKIKFTPRLS